MMAEINWICPFESFYVGIDTLDFFHDSCKKKHTIIFKNRNETREKKEVTMRGCGYMGLTHSMCLVLFQWSKLHRSTTIGALEADWYQDW